MNRMFRSWKDELSAGVESASPLAAEFRIRIGSPIWRVAGRIWFSIGPTVWRKSGRTWRSAGASAWAAGVSAREAGPTIRANSSELASVVRVSSSVDGNSRSDSRIDASWFAKDSRTSSEELTKRFSWSSRLPSSPASSP